MGSSEVTLRDRSFEAADSALEVWLRLLVTAIDGVPVQPDWLLAAREDWNDAATMGFGYGVIPELNDFLVDEDHRAVVLALCEQALARLRTLGDPIPAAVLNELEAGPADSRFTEDVPAALFQDVADRFIALIRDTPLE